MVTTASLDCDGYLISAPSPFKYHWGKELAGYDLMIQKATFIWSRHYSHLDWPGGRHNYRMHLLILRACHLENEAAYYHIRDQQRRYMVIQGTGALMRFRFADTLTCPSGHSLSLISQLNYSWMHWTYKKLGLPLQPNKLTNADGTLKNRLECTWKKSVGRCVGTKISGADGTLKK